jgi:hypothetical protein
MHSTASQTMQLHTCTIKGLFINIHHSLATLSSAMASMARRGAGAEKVQSLTEITGLF